MPLKTLRQSLLTKAIFKWGKKALPRLSNTEREALEAGDVWWDAELFTGNPDWSILLNTPHAKLSEEEKAFLDGPTETLCNMLDEWQINWKLKDLPPEVWDFLKKHKFFAMIIPKEFGGLGFSAYANSQIIRKVASRSVVAAVTVMVPNSLGPGELLIEFGTQEQQDYWLPRLADGSEVPCFGLTSPDGGSDAAAMKDSGVVCKGEFEGEEVLGIKLNWSKRYITLGPIATVLGLAFKLYDPDGLIGDKKDIGITLALIPTNLPGIDIGKRHLPCYQMFQNGPNWGKDVFIPMDFVIGGQDYVGKGWKMLMAALAAGRGISLPSLSAAGTAFAARTTGAYSKIRQQFKIPIGKFEGVQEKLGYMAAMAYQVDASRHLTCAGLDQGRKLAVISAIMKAHATDRMRESMNDALDIHAGKAVIDGPNNYLGSFYRSIPIGITVEGANILTRCMIIFGQGSIRCHPWLLKEMLALEEPDEKKALEDFDTAFWGHVGHSFMTLGRAWIRTWTGGLLSPAPNVSKKVRCYYKQVNRYAASFALLSDMVFLTLGGALKRREMLSARLGDILSHLYLLSSVLKRWEDEGHQEEDLPLVHYCMQNGFALIEGAYNAVLRNLPNRFVAYFVKFIGLPLGRQKFGPKDTLIRECAELLLAPSPTRDRLTTGLHYGDENCGVSKLEKAFDMVISVEPLRKKMKVEKITSYDDAVIKGIITKEEAESLRKVDAAVFDVINVDHFDAEEFASEKKDFSQG